jgi:hypothetical protein
LFPLHLIAPELVHHKQLITVCENTNKFPPNRHLKFIQDIKVAAYFSLQLIQQQVIQGCIKKYIYVCNTTEE